MRKVKVEKAVEVSKQQQQQQETTIKLEEDEEETFVKEEFIELLKNRLVNETVLGRQDIEGEWNRFPICIACVQYFGSGTVLDPDSIRSVDPYSGSGSRRAHKSFKIFCFEVLDSRF